MFPPSLAGKGARGLGTIRPEPHTSDAGPRLLCQAAGIRPGERVLDLGCEGRLASTTLSDTAEEILFVSSDIRDIRFCENEIGSCVGGCIKPVFTDTLEDIPDGAFGAVLYQPAQRAAKEWVFERIDGSFAKLAVGGRFCLAGRRDRGVESYRRRLEAVFGNARKVAQAGRLRTYVACKRAEVSGTDPVDTRYAFVVDDLPGGPYRFEARAGVFSRDGLDAGTRLLIEHMAVGAGDRVLDLGCGYGALGIVAARLAPEGEVVMVDVDLRAARCARANLAVNGIANACARVGNAFDGLADARFDLIVSNPPFHEGNATAHPFIDGAAAHLTPGGRLMMVVMRPEAYRRRMRRVFGRVEDAGARDGYTVLCASQAGT